MTRHSSSTGRYIPIPQREMVRPVVGSYPTEIAHDLVRRPQIFILGCTVLGSRGFSPGTAGPASSASVHGAPFADCHPCTREMKRPVSTNRPGIPARSGPWATPAQAPPLASPPAAGNGPSITIQVASPAKTRGSQDALPIRLPPFSVLAYVAFSTPSLAKIGLRTCLPEEWDRTKPGPKTS